MSTSEQKNNQSLFADILRVKGMTVEKLAQVTGISERFLELLLTEQYNKLPAAPYIHGYFIKIGEVIDIDGEDLWLEYQKQTHIIRRSGQHDKLPENRFSSFQINKKIIAISIIVIVIIIYIAFRIPTLLGKPTISLNINDNMIVSTSTLLISGNTDQKNTLTINNEALYPDSDGNFSKTMKLSPGFNTFTFTVKKLLGGENTLTRQIFYSTSSSTNSSTENSNQ